MGFKVLSGGLKKSSTLQPELEEPKFKVISGGLKSATTPKPFGGKVVDSDDPVLRAMTPEIKARFKVASPEQERAMKTMRAVRLLKGYPQYADPLTAMGEAYVSDLTQSKQYATPGLEQYRPIASTIGRIMSQIPKIGVAAKFTAPVAPKLGQAIPMLKELYPTASRVLANVIHSGIIGAGVRGAEETQRQVQEKKIEPIKIAKEAGWGGLTFAPWGVVPATKIGAEGGRFAGQVKRGLASAGVVGAGSTATQFLRNKKIGVEELGNIAVDAITAGVLHGYKGDQIAQAYKVKEIDDFLHNKAITKIKSIHPDWTPEEVRATAGMVRYSWINKPAVVEKIVKDIEYKIPKGLIEYQKEPLFKAKAPQLPEVPPPVAPVAKIMPQAIPKTHPSEMTVRRADEAIREKLGIAKFSEKITPALAQPQPTQPQPIPQGKQGIVEGEGIEYGMQHRPTEGPPANDLLAKVDGGDFAPKDIYEHPEWYANGDDSLADRQSIAAIRSLRGRPNAMVTIYRASPKNELRTGDWVSLSKDYAKGESLTEGVKVSSFRVKAADVKWAGDSLNEFGYFGKPILQSPEKIVEGFEKEGAYIQKKGKIPPNADMTGFKKSKEYLKYGTTERQQASAYYEYIGNKINDLKAQISQPKGEGEQISKKSEGMEKRIVTVELAKDRLSEINAIRKKFIHRIRKYKKGYLKEELQGLPKIYSTVEGGIAPYEAMEILRNMGVDIPDEVVLKEYFQELEKEVSSLKEVIATNKPKFIRRSELTILKREQKIVESMQKKFTGQAAKMTEKQTKGMEGMVKKAFSEGKKAGAEIRKVKYFGPQITKEERKELYWKAMQKGLIYTDISDKKHDKLRGLIQHYKDASFTQLNEYISQLAGTPEHQPLLLKLYGDIGKDAEVMQLINDASKDWEDINKLEAGTLDPVRIVEKVTQLPIWGDALNGNVLADNTFNTFASANEAMFDRLSREIDELDKSREGITKYSKADQELMRKYEANEKLTDKEQKVLNYLRQKLDSIFNEANKSRSRLGAKPILYRHKYLPHIIEENLLHEFFKGDEKNMQKVTPEQLDAIRKSDYTKGYMPFNKFAQRRRGKMTKFGAIGNYEIYLRTLLKEIYYAPAIKHARKFIEYALRNQPNAYKALDRLLNELKGKNSIIDDVPFLNIASLPAIKTLRRLAAQSALLGNFNFWAVNLSNFTVSFDELGQYMAVGMNKFLGTKEWRSFAFQHSQMLKGRTIDPDIDPSTFSTLQEALGYMTNLIEYNNVGSTFIGAYFKATEQLKYPKEKAIKYADAIARRTQVGYKKFELNAWMRSNAGMVLSQFQSWAFNAMNHLVYDLGLGNIPRNLLSPFTGKKPRKVRWGAFFILVVISTLVNLMYKKLGLRAPYEPKSVVPRVPYLTTSRYEEPMLVSARRDIGTLFTGKKPETRQKAGGRLATRFLPGGTQLGRFMGGRIFPQQKQSEEEAPRFTSSPFRSKFKPKFKSAFKSKF